MWFVLLLALAFEAGPPAECLLQPPKRPSIPPTFAFPKPGAGDTLTSRTDTATGYYTDLAAIRFRASATAAELCAVFVRHQATLIGGLPNMREYVARLPSRPMNWKSWKARLDSLTAEPSVEYAAPISWKAGFTAK